MTDLDANNLQPALIKVTLENIFSFKSAEVKLGRLNVLVGQNGAGKSNLLKVISFIGQTARSDLLPAIESFGGLDRITFQGERKSPVIRIRFELSITKYASLNAPDVYELSFYKGRGSTRHTVVRRNETLLFKRYKGRGRRITVEGGRFYVQEEGAKAEVAKKSVLIGSASAGLATIRRLGEVYGADQVNDLANLFETFRVFEIDARLATLPSIRARSPELQPNAANLAAYLFNLQQTRPDLIEAISDDLIAVAPSVRGLRVRPFGAGSDDGFVIEIDERGLSDPTPLSAASFGTVRALALFAMLHDPNPPRLTCIEEIDHGLHPHALDRVVDRLRSAAERTQIIAVTHSPALVNRLDPKELVVFERDTDTGETLVPEINPASVRAAGEDAGLGLGEMWFSGILGGVPK